MAENKKRAAPSSSSDPAGKKPKTRKQWQVPRKNPPPAAATIEPGDAGIWVTCVLNKEAKCIGELRDLFQEYAEKLYGADVTGNGDAESRNDDTEADIEAEIEAEVQGLQKPIAAPLFVNVRIDVQCVLFFKTRPPIEPVSFVEAICADALATGKQKTRFAKRLTPMTVMGRASESGLEGVAEKVLGPVFFGEGNEGKKFAIRPTLRNHSNILSRDLIIKQVAELVGSGHKVDLTNPEYNIIVEVYRNICGMSVVGANYDKLKRFNLSEIYQPSSAGDKQAAPAAVGKVAEKKEVEEAPEATLEA